MRATMKPVYLLRDWRRGETVICPRCKREVHPWPLARGGRCSPRDWVYCIRNDLGEGDE